ncbi:putative peptide chain release factor-like protein [Colletotrichum orbiculare MAFF 240422]|uniref:Peptide chain release factor-like protein n=1 Tax=Colletotrichum orbiculare (strain 104-T / ATCC 96160 / CBS 514.97 / LARS 414 / MAFF 240422) TaxID=1213857 RepID=N4UU55_COLOR|nr:putative peptide chain release factor-like protein [Colletotrichum orbiculare MAFF 240422]
MPPPHIARLLTSSFSAARNRSSNVLKETSFPPPPRVPTLPPAAAAPFVTSSRLALKKHEMPPRPKPPPDSEIEESYLKGSGPGGQKINKTSSAVQLKHIPTGIVVKSQATRSRSQNRKIAREILAQKIDDLQNGGQSRSAIVGEVKRKKAASAAKKSKRKYRKLDDDNKEGEGEEPLPEEVEAAADPVEEQTNGAQSALVKPADEPSQK